MEEPIPLQSNSPLARVGRAFLNFSLAFAMILLACLIGLGGAAFFIYHQLGHNVSLSKTSPSRRAAPALDTDSSAPSSTPLPGNATTEQPTSKATVSDASEWHFAEFSDQPRYIDVTYDGGRQHARLKVNTVLSSKPEGSFAASSVSDVDANDADDPVLRADPGSRYITDKNTGRVIGIDGTAGAAREVRRAEAVISMPSEATIRNPEPEVRVASPVLRFGQPSFDADRPVQPAYPASTTYLPTRKALPVYSTDSSADDDAPFDVKSELSDDNSHTRRAVPVRSGANSLPGDQRYPTSDRTYIFGRNR